MKRNLQILSSATAASLLTITVLSQDGSKSKGDRSDYGQARSARVHADRLNGAAKANDIIGMTVNNYQDEKLGKVEDLAVDLESGRIVQVIISTGGFIGVGDRLSAVPPGALHHDVAQKVLHLDANKEKLKGAPEFKAANWAESFDRDQLSSSYGYYGQEPSLKFIRNGDSTESHDPLRTRNADSLRNQDRTADTTQNQDRTPEAIRNQDRTAEAIRNQDRTADANRNQDRTAGANRNQDRTAGAIRNQDRTAGEHQWTIPASRLGQVQKASKVIGMTVKNRQDEKVGTVDNLMVDMQSGRIVLVVVSAGGFIGIGNELSAVPPTALRFNAERDTLELDTTKEQLIAAPHFQSGQWPDFGQPQYADGIYRAHRMEPYFTTNVLTEADNAVLNQRDRGNRTLTPFNQGNSQADTDTTAQIRKGILAGRDMSVSAKNVKIITNQGQVTLRGPVNSAEEKRMIGEIANRIAFAGNVDNQLEVK